jgi:phosphoribosylformimino-5-aminoimidazole carboxamide ribonucleotide (ProFAR) isomerase
VELAAVVVTAIDRDGTLAGPDLDGLRAVLAETTLPVIASGGVGSVADIQALAQLGVPGRDHRDDGGGARVTSVRRLAGTITGKALVDGRMSVGEAVIACTQSE